MSNILETLEFIVKGIVPEHDLISVTQTVQDDITVLTVDAPSEVTGQIIGKQGKVVKAIRTILTLTYPQQKFSIEFKN